MPPDEPTLPSTEGVEERVDPFARLSPYSLDHLARYALASSQVEGKRVLDAASGTGFGARLLAECGAARVDAVDLEEATLEVGRERYPHAAVHPRRADLDQPGSLPEGPWDLVCSFETLEHLRAPGVFLSEVAARLAPGGLVFLSVPGEADAAQDNAFHLQHYTRESFTALLREHFREVVVLEQRLTVGVAFGATEGATEVGPAEELPLEATPPPVDGYLAIAGETIPKELKGAFLWHAPAVWAQLAAERRQLYAECTRFADEHRRTFAELADLRQKFSACLAWGQAYYNTATGEKAEGEEPIEALRTATFAEADRLRAALTAAERRAEALEAELAQLRSFRPGGEAHGRLKRIAAFFHRWRKGS
ncbi:MAG: class I SAM-dependent methyltransferase [Verrucomicrobiota bacterium]